MLGRDVFEFPRHPVSLRWERKLRRRDAKDAKSLVAFVTIGLSLLLGPIITFDVLRLIRFLPAHHAKQVNSSWLRSSSHFAKAQLVLLGLFRKNGWHLEGVGVPIAEDYNFDPKILRNYY